MSNNYPVYRAAATQLARNGWTQSQGRDPNGYTCMLQALRDCAGIDKRYCLPDSMLAELNEALQRFPYYRLCRWFHLRQYSPIAIEDALVNWNDAHWRRTRTIISVLNSLADTYELEWRRIESVAHGTYLRHQPELQLQKQIEQLQAENAVLQHQLELSEIDAHLNRILIESITPTIQRTVKTG